MVPQGLPNATQGHHKSFIIWAGGHRHFYYMGLVTAQSAQMDSKVMKSHENASLGVPKKLIWVKIYVNFIPLSLFFLASGESFTLQQKLTYQSSDGGAFL